MIKCQLLDRMPDEYSRDLHERCCAACIDNADDLGITVKESDSSDLPSHEFCQCGHRVQSHDDRYGYCKAVVEPPAETAGYELKYWPCHCRRLILAERP